MLVTQTTGSETPEKKPAPWEQTWVLKPVQALTDAVDTAKKAVEGIKMPWERDWKEKARPTPSQTFKVPEKVVDMSTEKKMKEAAIINVNERMPDSQTHQSNIEEIDQELSKTKDQNIKKILLAEKEKFLKLIEKEKASAKTR